MIVWEKAVPDRVIATPGTAFLLRIGVRGNPARREAPGSA
ncbi:hypothetical protein SAEN111111_06935 [Saccharibacillus endophyticus]